LQRDFCTGFCDFPGLCGFAPHTLDGEPSNFASTPGFGLTRLFGCRAYRPGNQDRRQVFAAARKSSWLFGIEVFRNSAGSLCVDREQTESRNGRTAPSAWFLSLRNQSDGARQKNQSYDRGEAATPLRQQLKEAEGLGRKRISRMRSEEDLKENWPDFKPETLACLLADQNGSLSHRPRYNYNENSISRPLLLRVFA
jgi:hypothetical protein